MGFKIALQSGVNFPSACHVLCCVLCSTVCTVLRLNYNSQSFSTDGAGAKSDGEYHNIIAPYQICEYIF